MTNHLSYLILEAADSINIATNLTVRVHENCDKEFFRKSVYYLLKNKNGWPRFCNDKSLAEGYMRNGIDKNIARERIAVGCNWMCVPGKEFPMNDTVKVNVAKVLEEALKDLISPNAVREVTPQLIINVVSEHFGINSLDIIGQKRSKELVFPRQIVMYLCGTMTTESLQNIGKALGGRDHTTIIHGQKKIASEIDKDETLKNTVDILKKKINPQ